MLVKKLKKKKIWLVIEWVTPIGSHFRGHYPFLGSTNRDTKNVFFG